MSILIDEESRVLVQGITGKEGSFHTRAMIDYGTEVVGGVTPGKGGETLGEVPVFDSVRQALREVGPLAATVIFVPPSFAADAVLEAADNEIPLIVCITEHIPTHDTMRVKHYLQGYGSSLLVGPNGPGLISPGRSKVGIMPGDIFRRGKVGIVSRSGTLTYEIASLFSEAGLGQSTVLGIGGDQIRGISFVEALKRFERDRETSLIVLVGEIGGSEEEKAARYFKRNSLDTPVISYIAGFSAPRGKRMGHAGAIASKEEGTAEAKANTMEKNGIPVARIPGELIELARAKLE